MIDKVSIVAIRLAFQVIFLACWVVPLSFVALATEDVEIPEDEERRLPTQTVTATRSSGVSSNVGSILSIARGGSLIELGALGLQGDAYSFAIACRRNPDSDWCRRLACEIAPKSKECELRLKKIVVTAERPKQTDYSNYFTVQIEYPPLWFININKKSEKEKKEERRKKLEEQCRAAYKKIFSDLGEFNFGFTFGSAVGGSMNAINGRAVDKTAQEKVLKQLVDVTKPIMTTGVHGTSPVDYKKGQEAVNGIYLNVTNNKITRGTHLTKGDNNDGKARREFELDEQFKHTKIGGSEVVTHRLIGDFHTHPQRITGNPAIPWYAWASGQDVYSHVLQKIHRTIDLDAILMIGFIVDRKYYLQLIEVHNDIKLETLSYYRNNPQKFGKFLQLLFNSNTKIAIIDENGKKIDYVKFFKNNPSQTSAFGIQITPSSCDQL